MATSDYTDEDLYMHYRPYSADEQTCLSIIAEHRARFPERQVRTDGDWTGMSRTEIEAAILDGAKRAALMPPGQERQDLISHILGGARLKRVR